MSADDPGGRRPGETDDEYIRRNWSPVGELHDAVARLTAHVAERDARHERQMEFVVSTLASVADQQAQTAAALADEAAARRAHESASDRRLDRIERVAKLFVTVGRRTRREVREHLAALTSAQIMSEDARRADRERIDALLAATERLTTSQEGDREGIAAVAEAQARDRENINALADVVRQLATRQNGNGDKGGIRNSDEPRTTPTNRDDE